MSSTKWITLNQNDPQLLSYLWGTFSKTERALPVASLNANPISTQTTFEIRTVEQSSVWVRLLTSLKYRNLIWLLVPCFVILVKNEVDETLKQPWLAGLSILGAICLQLGIELSNDVRDHLQGLDRLHPQSWNLALQKGYSSAKDLWNLSWVLLGLGFFLGLPALLAYPEIAIFLLPFFILGFVFYKKTQTAFKYKMGSELFVFLMFGPLLTIGFQMSFGGGFDLEALFIGILAGVLAVFQIHLKNFSYLMVNFQSRNGNSVMRWGFDKSKRNLSIWWMIYVGLMLVFHSVYSVGFELLLDVLILAPCSIFLFRSFSKLDSPLGSRMTRALALGRRLALLAGALWCFEMLFLLISIELH